MQHTKGTALADSIQIQRFITAIMACQDDEELLTRFLQEILSHDELRAFANRWAIAEMLLENKSQIETKNKLGTSTATVSRVAKWVIGSQTLGGCADVYKLMKRAQGQRETLDEVTGV